MRTICIFILITLSGCSAQWHLKQAIKKDPTLIQDRTRILIDTFIVIDSFSSIDTFITNETDTIRINQHGINTEIIRYKDRVIVKQRKVSDTIRITKEIRIPQIKYIKKNGYPEWLYWVIIISISVIGGCLIIRK